MELFHGPSATKAFLPVLLIAIVIEATLYWRRNGRYQWRDGIASLVIAIGHGLSGIVTHAVINTGLALLVWRYRMTTVDLGQWTNLVLLFLLIEFAYYWYHRAAHRVRLLWGSHSVHHSPEELTFSAAYRLNWTPLLSGAWLFFLPLVWLGFDPAYVFAIVSASLLYQFWLHTTLIPRLGPLEWVFNTPSSHRVHHASNPEYLDRNYGGTLIVFDRLFGTYRKEDPTIAIRFGLVHPVASLNPFVIVFHEFAAILSDLRRASNWHDRLAHVFAPPGWQRADRGAAGTTQP